MHIITVTYYISMEIFLLSPRASLSPGEGLGSNIDKIKKT